MKVELKGIEGAGIGVASHTMIVYILGQID